MNLVTQLVDIPLPASIPWWPLEPGWYGIMFVVLLFLIVVIVRQRRRWIANAYRRAALRQLQSLTVHDAAVMNQVMRRTAMLAMQCDNKLSQIGGPWYRLIMNSSPEAIFTEMQLIRLEALNYQSSKHLSQHLSKSDFSKLNQLCQRWVKEHRFEH
ncbi:DUF4381 domain-containing protein [Shewanella sp. KX20019]|uniref:DUF4381 domain-containing protein n=1 Tax=Shewanella sp. KX20019 TaxID=2803864 RepID=UPI00192727D6|nr:DUF4381 domain-containing protein [Shewanella sp. KX20019]QQX81630.1 DUF4381 domain-containing protein [Shewanella sp. KX20019]